MVLADESLHPAGVDFRDIAHCQRCRLDDEVVGGEFEGTLLGGVDGLPHSQSLGHIDIHSEIVVRNALLGLLQSLSNSLHTKWVKGTTKYILNPRYLYVLLKAGDGGRGSYAI